MKPSLASMLVAGLILAGATEAAAQCLEADKPGVQAEGALALRTFRDAARRPETAFILTLPAPVCLAGNDDMDTVKSARTIQVFSTDDAMMQRIQGFVGRRVVVRGTAYGAHTVHHHAPIIMDVSEIAPAGAQRSATPRSTAMVVEPTGNPNPVYATSRDPTAEELIETWRASNKFLTDKKVDRERFEIVDRRVAWDKTGRAFLQFRVLSPDGDALSFARSRCHGRSRSVEIQVYYQFSPVLGAWVPHFRRGESEEGLCSDQKLWTGEQIERLLNPPPLPVPPKISRRDVFTPARGSRERVAIMDGLRPRYETLFGKPIEFRVERLLVAAGFAFVVVHPQRPNGAPIEKAVWERMLGGDCFQVPETVTHEYWLQKRDGVWTIGIDNDMCADDSIADQGDLIGAPPQLAGRDAWPEREFMPEPK